MKINFAILKQNDFKLSEKTNGITLYVSFGLLLTISLSYFLYFGKGLFFCIENSSLFIFSKDYLFDYLLKPGGLLEYLGNFITQGYCSRIYGSLIVTLFLVLSATMFIRICRLLSTHIPEWLILILIPSCLLLLIQMRPDNRVHHTLGYLLVVYYFLITLIFETKRLSLLTLVLFPLFFYITGSFALVFTIIYIDYCLVYKKGPSRYLLPGIMILVSVFTFLLFERILFLQPHGMSLRYPLPLIAEVGLHPIDIFLCCYLVLYPLIIKITASIKPGERFSRLVLQTGLILVISATLLVMTKLYDPEFEKYTQFETNFIDREWDEIIRQHEEDPSKSVIGQYYYNLALAGEGQLCNRMFFGSQDFGTESLILPREPEFINRSVYFYYTVGLINEAHHLAYESMVKYGYRPENIKMLVKTEIITGNFKSAERYLEILRETFRYRKWANTYIQMLNEPALILADPDLGEKIKLLPRKDFFLSRDNAANLDYMLLSNPDNAIALEYKMAWFLLKKDYKAVVNQVKRLKDVNYSYIPRHIGEAVMLFMDSDLELPYLGDFTVDRETENLYKQYVRASEIAKNETEFKNITDTSLEKTFWYYYEFK